MAYSNLENIAWGSSPNITGSIDCDYKRSGSDMQYKVRVTINTLPTSTSTFGYPIYADIYLDGAKQGSTHTIKNASPNKWSSAYVYETDWLTVKNKTSGTTKLSVNIYSGMGESRDKTYSYDLTVSPAASIPTAEASIVELGSSVKIFTNSRDSSYYHRIGCKFGSYSHWGKSIFDADTAKSWFLFSPPVSLASEIPNAESGICTISLVTYSDAECTKQVGSTQTMTLTLKVPASVKPTVSSVAFSDEAGYLSTFSAYVQGKSRLMLKATASQAYGSPIKSYTFIVDGKTTAATSNEATVDLLSAGTIPVKVRVTDGRGRVSADYSTTITVLPYAAPQITAMTAVRCKSNGTPDPAGTYVNVVFSGAISPLNNINNAVWKVGRKKPTDEYWTDTTVTISQKYAPNNISKIITGVAANSPYIFRISATDAVTGTVTSVEIPVPSGYAFFRTNADMSGLSFGKEEVKDDTLCVAWDMEVDGSVKIEDDLNVEAKVSANGGLDVTGGITSDGLTVFPFKVVTCKKASTTQSAVNDYWRLSCPAETGFSRVVVDIHTSEPGSIIVKNFDFDGNYIRVYLQNTSGSSKTFAMTAVVLFIADSNIETINT